MATVNRPLMYQARCCRECFFRIQRSSMDVTVAISAQCNQIFFYVVTEQASRAHVVDLKTIGTAAILAFPALTLQHFGAEFAIGIWVEPNSRPSRLEISQ